MKILLILFVTRVRDQTSRGYMTIDYWGLSQPSSKYKLHKILFIYLSIFMQCLLFYALLVANLKNAQKSLTKKNICDIYLINIINVDKLKIKIIRALIENNISN